MQGGLLKSFFVKTFYKGLAEDEQAVFRLKTALKLTLTPFLSLLLLFGFFYVLMQMDLYFFEVNGWANIEGFSETYYDYFFNRLSDFIPYAFFYFVINIFLGLYLADMLLRPFRTLGNYCEKKTAGENVFYDPDYFSELKLMTRFSEYFFNVVESAEKTGKLSIMEVPKRYTKIHKPVAEVSFFIQFAVYVLLTSVIVSVSLYILAVDVHDSTIQLGLQSLDQHQIISKFLTRQKELFPQILSVIIFFNTLFYFLLSTHLYLKISGPAFGIFASMRAFVKGNYNARIHLIGHYYLRPECRKINKYLDYVQKAYVKS